MSAIGETEKLVASYEELAWPYTPDFAMTLLTMTECVSVPVSGLPTPLDVLLRVMHRKWADGDLDGAATLAKIAAPYLHARLPAARPSADLRTMTDAEIDGLCDDGRGAGENTPAHAAEQPC